MTGIGELKKNGNSARKDRIISGAEKVFRAVGYRNATMEAIAVSSAVAKPTLYAYFKNKDEVFREVAFDITERIRKEVASAIQKSHDPVDRIIGVLLGRYLTIFDLATGTAHAEELIKINAVLALDIYQKLDEELAARIGELCRQLYEPNPAYCGGLLLRAARGLGMTSVSREALMDDLTALVSGYFDRGRPMAMGVA